MDINEILIRAKQAGASDTHLTVGRPPVFRLHGDIKPQDAWDILTPEATEKLCRQMMDERFLALAEKNGEVDFSYEIDGVGRYRVNVFKQKGTYSAAIRTINSQILSLEQLHLPSVLNDLCKKPRGLVLVTGPTGSGKTTTLAAMIDLINREQKRHILTLEDPIEFIHCHRNSIVNQREIGSDSMSFAGALRAGLRQDPDVILVGEMRDIETISIAVTAAETGHLVFATLHTSSAAQTVERIVDVFPPHQQTQIRVQLAATIQGIVSQTLVKRADKEGRIAAVEVLIGTPAVRNLIREGKTHQINSMIQAGGQYGMQTLEASFKKLVLAGTVSAETAVVHGIHLNGLFKENSSQNFGENF
ncbi:type IV pilus twitching motility protein PilT [Candidatus Formimonas warabiya]|uniref:Type IV pili twitching motility protein PilT n=1 Tax=Formimonas warabiya TaxID=1761012 RepID=A0A3G1KNF2_FORW1|nr:type IV pilus twitching motility protein PilT [Candidatus Formimonas warabiya]ATW23988.1 type IV pili twitching motility protein PilT [Candidatus Formimonas warabiya]